jgi:RNA polymerase sigma factor (sigma-70 family)
VGLTRQLLVVAIRDKTEQAENLTLINQAKQGDRHAADRLVRGNLLTLIRVARTFRETSTVSTDDLVAEGMSLIVFKYMPAYDPNKASFSSFVSSSLRKDLIQMVSRDGHAGFRRPAGYLTRRAKDKCAKCPSCVPIDPLQLEERSDSDRDSLAEAVKQLVGLERRIVEMRYGLNGSATTLREIATRLGMSKDSVWRIEARALARLRSLL